jgi:hypothetical protein
VFLALALLAIAGLVLGDRIISERTGPRRVALRRLRSGPTTAAAGAPLRVIGTVTAVPHPLRAPLSHRSCALYCAWVDVSVRQTITVPGGPFGATRPHGTQRFTALESRVTEFLLSTEVGVVRVIGDRADLAFAIPPVRRWPKDRADAFTYQWRTLSARPARRLRELAIVPGDKISVYGVLSEEPLTHRDERSYREASVGMCLRGSPEAPLTIGPA